MSSRSGIPFTFIPERITNVLFLTSDNEFSGKIRNLFGDRQSKFITIFNTTLVLKCPAKILKAVNK